MIAPPFYMGGVQALTRHFPGTFTFSKETIMACIEEYLENLDRFGFKRVVVFNDHGDGLHISAIVEVIKNANRRLELMESIFSINVDLMNIEDCYQKLDFFVNQYQIDTVITKKQFIYFAARLLWNNDYINIS